MLSFEDCCLRRLKSIRAADDPSNHGFISAQTFAARKRLSEKGPLP